MLDADADTTTTTILRHVVHNLKSSSLWGALFVEDIYKIEWLFVLIIWLHVLGEAYNVSSFSWYYLGDTWWPTKELHRVHVRFTGGSIASDAVGRVQKFQLRLLLPFLVSLPMSFKYDEDSIRVGGGGGKGKQKSGLDGISVNEDLSLGLWKC